MEKARRLTPGSILKNLSQFFVYECNQIKTIMKVEIETKQTYFEELAKLMIKYLAENHNPHTTIIITSASAELVEGKMCVETNEFLID